MGRYNYTPIRRELAERIRKIIEMEIGYRSTADFVNDAVRRRLEEIEILMEKLRPELLPSPGMPPAGRGVGAGADSGRMRPEQLERGGSSGTD